MAPERKDDNKPISRSHVKRPYCRPHLDVYGDLREITQAIFGGMGNVDGIPPVPLRKTQTDT